VSIQNKVRHEVRKMVKSGYKAEQENKWMDFGVRAISENWTWKEEMASVGQQWVNDLWAREL